MEGDLAFCGAEPFLVGLSPGYWSYIPMCIADVNNLKLVQGVSCLIRDKDIEGCGCTSTSTNTQCYPVSRCKLAGTIVYANSRAKQMEYILDDGTGLLDCVAWDNNDEDSKYYLPRLGPHVDAANQEETAINSSSNRRSRFSEKRHAEKAQQYKSHHRHHESLKDANFSVGDRVRVIGRLKCRGTSDVAEYLRVAGSQQLEVRKGIFELTVKTMEKLEATNPELTWEANHWVNAIASTQPATKANKQGLRNAAQVMEWLGAQIRSAVANREHLPSAEKETRKWRVFGMDCSCDLLYKDALLYCHCHAKPEPLDPNFVYRDSLLGILLDMEKEQHSTNSAQAPDFRFQFKMIASHTQLCNIAKQVVANTINPHLAVKNIILATFSALRHDGVVSLLDESSDTFVLVSRKGVLEPYLHRRIQRNIKTNLPVPYYLQNVPRPRLDYVKSAMNNK